MKATDRFCLLVKLQPSKKGHWWMKERREQPAGGAARDWARVFCSPLAQTLASFSRQEHLTA